MCIFCDIIEKELPSKLVFEDDNYVAFNDINPKAKTHILVVPKKHIERFDKIDSEEDLEISKWLLDVANKIIKDKKLNWCQLHMNCWASHGQLVMHIHLHLLSGGSW